MKVQLVNPSAPEPAAAAPSAGINQLTRSRVGVLENGKQHAELILTSIAELLGGSHGVELVTVTHKSVAAAADPAVIDELAESVDWVLVGSAD